MPTKPKVQIDEDGDGDTDVTVEIDTPPGDGTLPGDVRDILTGLVDRMEVVLPQVSTRISYAAVRETLRGLLNN